MVLVDNVLVDLAEGMPEKEAMLYVKEEIEQWKQKGKAIDRIQLSLENDEVVIRAFEKSPIRRVRRITGYLSDATNFNDAKRAELADRVIHTA